MQNSALSAQESKQIGQICNVRGSDQEVRRNDFGQMVYFTHQKRKARWA